MEYINHFTANTGHVKKSYRGEVDNEFIIKFKPLVEAIVNNGICEFDAMPGVQTYLEITVEENDAYAATIYIDYESKKTPIMVSFGTSADSKRNDIEGYIKPFRAILDSKVNYLLPKAPFVVDIMLPASVLMGIGFAMVSADLSRCLAWVLLG